MAQQVTSIPTATQLCAVGNYAQFAPTRFRDRIVRLLSGSPGAFPTRHNFRWFPVESAPWRDLIAAMAPPGSKLTRYRPIDALLKFLESL